MTKLCRPPRFLAGGALLALVAVFSGCAESNFDLAEDSRVPVWFKLPDGTTRADVRLSATYYIVPYEHVALELSRKSGKVIAKATGHIVSTSGGITFPDLMTGDRRRMFQVITVGGTPELFEYQPAFVDGYRTMALQVCDEPEIRARVGVPMYEGSHAPH